MVRPLAYITSNWSDDEFEARSMARKFCRNCPDRYNELLLSGKLWTYLADLNEQAQNRLDYIIVQMKEAEGIMEELKACDQMAWVRAMNSIRNRAEEIIRSEMIYC